MSIKILPIGLGVCLVLITTHIECSGSARALHYLKLAGSTTWKTAKKTTQLVGKNPYKITGSLFTASGAALGYLEINYTQMDIKQRLEKPTDLKEEIVTMIKDVCREHGINDPIILGLSLNSKSIENND